MTESTPAGRSIWTRIERPGRGPVPEHSRAEIASAGIAQADVAGLGAVTMRKANCRPIFRRLRPPAMPRTWPRP